MRKHILLHACLAISAVLTVTVPAAAQRSEAEKSLGQVASDFMAAFNALDAKRFDAFFAEDVTMFFPSGPFPKDRVVGKAAVTAAFHRAFEMARQRGASRLSIEPLDTNLQAFDKFGIATFHLRGNGNIGRRSLVLQRRGGRWFIVHFHASSLEAPA